MRSVRSITVSHPRPVRHIVQRLRCLARTARDSRGVALITATFVVFAVGMMLFAFVFLTQGEVGFASLNRSSTLALNLAEAGVQEAAKRLSMFGAAPGSTAFTNSLTSGTVGSGTVTYQAALQNNPQIFPILSVATFAGVQRAVRILERVAYKAGFGNAIVVPQAFSEETNFTAVTADMYVQGSISLEETGWSCGSGATATNLVPPQLLTGTTINGEGMNINAQCGGSGTGTFTYECANGSLTEVAPTPCPRSSNLPYHWHPMIPIGMASGDFNAVVTASSLPSGISVVQATQNGVGVTYTSAGTYTPSYWTGVPSTNGKVMLIPGTQPFCVQASPASVILPSPPITGTCAAGYTRYGNNTGGTANQTRFLDWGLVQDDLTRSQAQTFFQPPLCTAPCANPGNQNGIRYFPILPTVNIIAEACVQHVNPGTNVFDQVNTGDGVSCTNPPITTILSTSVTFSGTKSNPEALVIDNAGAGSVSITGSLPSSGLTCTNNFNNSNWGMILASGDITLGSNLVLSGYIYSQGNITIQSGFTMSGGIFSPQGNNNQLSFPEENAVALCGGANMNMMSSVFSNFSTMTWQDRPANKP